MLKRMLCATSLLLCMSIGAVAGDDGTELGIRTLSTRADRVSGGDVLVEIRFEQRNNDRPLRITLNGKDVSAAFRPGEAPNTLVGLVTGLAPGRNTLRAQGDGSATLEITNYPITGPITSGPHIKPFICQTQSFKLPDGTFFGASTDAADCSAPTKVTYLYMPAGGSAFVPLPSLTSLPANVAKTTTTTGATVNFVVRVETSTIDRGIYQSAILHDPTSDAPPGPFSPPKGWNRRLIAIEGFGCPGGWYIQGPSMGSLVLPGVLDANLFSPGRLGEGYATFSNTLQHPSNNCNSVLSAEAAMMGKEHFIETYGVPRYTVSTGCSGGSYGSIQLADQLPGLFDGALIACTFPDPLGIAFSGSDGRLLTHYFTATDPGGFTEDQQVQVSGYKGLTAFVDAARQSGRTDPIPGRVDLPGYSSAPFTPAVPLALRYDPITNRTGARGTVYDAAHNIYGINPVTGFALRPFDNVGVQYGLRALNAGRITPAQFLKLNERIGGYDQDTNYVASRSVGDPGAIRRAYQSGLQLGGGGGLASIPVVDISGIYNDDGVVPLRHARAHGPGERQHRQPCDVARQPRAAGALLANVHPMGRGGQRRHLRSPRAREGHPEQAGRRCGRLLVQPHAVHRRAADIRQRPAFLALQRAVPLVRLSAPRGGRSARGEQPPVPPEADRSGRLRGLVHTGRVGAAACHLPDRRVRLVEARRRIPRRRALGLVRTGAREPGIRRDAPRCRRRRRGRRPVVTVMISPRARPPRVLGWGSLAARVVFAALPLDDQPLKQ